LAFGFYIMLKKERNSL